MERPIERAVFHFDAPSGALLNGVHDAETVDRPFHLDGPEDKKVEVSVEAARGFGGHVIPHSGLAKTRSSEQISIFHETPSKPRRLPGAHRRGGEPGRQACVSPPECREGMVRQGILGLVVFRPADYLRRQTE
jgi:hypothetical protein